MRFLTAFTTVIATLSTAFSALAASEFDRPWRDANTALVVDGYVFTEFDWEKLTKNERLVGFINKASDGQITSAACGRGNATARKVCWAKWRRYVATREVYNTRKVLAKNLGFKWGSYHLGRPGNPIRQAQHYLDYAKPGPDDLIALDIEDRNPKWMSLDDAEIFVNFINRKLGRFPLLYTNHSTAKAIAANPARWPSLSKINLWYARYKANTSGTFPMGHWKSYTMWQFAAQVNCRRDRCPMRLHGTDRRVDINVVNLTPDELREAWPLSELFAYRDLPETLVKRSTVSEPQPLWLAQRKIRVPAIRQANQPNLLALAFAPELRTEAVEAFEKVLRQVDTIEIELPRKVIVPTKAVRVVEVERAAPTVPVLPASMVAEAKGAWAQPRFPAGAARKRGTVVRPLPARDPIYTLNRAGLLRTNVEAR